MGQPTMILPGLTPTEFAEDSLAVATNSIGLVLRSQKGGNKMSPSETISLVRTPNLAKREVIAPLPLQDKWPK